MDDKTRPRMRGFYKLSDAIAEAYYEGDDMALADAIERMAYATGYERRSRKRGKYQEKKNAL